MKSSANQANNATAKRPKEFSVQVRQLVCLPLIIASIGLAISLGLSMVVSSAHAFSTSDQCDYQESGSNWQVTNVRSNDVLNMRRDPDPKSSKIHTLPYNARNIEVICCIKKARGADWCLAQQPSTGKSGWISKRFVTPAYRTTYTPQQTKRSSSSKPQSSYVSKYINDNYARLLVEKMYREYGYVNTGNDRQFFRTFVHSQHLNQYLKSISGADPLYFSQDTGEIKNLRIFNDPVYPTQNGNYYVNVSFDDSNEFYTRHVSAIYRLRVDKNNRLRIVDFQIYEY